MRSGQSVYLTKNGEGGLVIMTLKFCARCKSMLRLRERLLAAEKGRLGGQKGYSIDEISKMMRGAVKEVLEGQRK